MIGCLICSGCSSGAQKPETEDGVTQVFVPVVAKETTIADDQARNVNSAEDDDYADDFEGEFNEGEAETQIYDPLEPVNRLSQGFNDLFYDYALYPVSYAYYHVVPKFARTGVANFFHNLYYPIRFINNVLQLKITNSGEETLRFLVNSTIGVLGLWDAAGDLFGLEPHNEDFGQTLGHWGLDPGIYLVIPFTGPSSLRDGFGEGLEYYSKLDALRFVDEENQAFVDGEFAARFFRQVSWDSENFGQYKGLRKDALDFYTFLREAYYQNRAKQVEE